MAFQSPAAISAGAVIHDVQASRQQRIGKGKGVVGPVERGHCQEAAPLDSLCQHAATLTPGLSPASQYDTRRLAQADLCAILVPVRVAVGNPRMPFVNHNREKQMMVKTSMIAALLAVVAAGPVCAGDVYKSDSAHADVGFAISHMVISKVKGSFNDFDATLTTNDDGSLASVNADIKAASIDTANDKRDEHLRSADFFNVEKYPEITFRSTAIETSGGNTTVKGALTMHGVTKDVDLAATLKGPVKDPWGNTKLGLELRGTLDRRDYGLTWSKALETGGLVVGQDVDLLIDVEFAKQ
jgi:polyisoprenoid-binding protein YceI